MGELNQTIIATSEQTSKDLAKISGLAYGGGGIKQWWDDRDMYIELSGMEMAAQIPLLLSHHNHPACRLGVVTANVADGQLHIAGGIDTGTEEGQEIVAKGKKYEWQLSIGADVVQAMGIPENETRVINGKEVQGPLLLVTKSKLREVSVVAVGADAETYMQIAASFNLNFSKQENPKKGESMADENTKNQGEDITAEAIANKAITAERKRVADIKAICNGEYPEIEAEAISAGWEPGTVTDKVLKELRANRPQADVNISVKGRPENAEAKKTLEAAMCLRCGIEEETVLKSYGEKVLEAASKECDISLQQILADACHYDGIPTPRTFGNDTIRAAFSSVTLPGILSNVANKKLMQGFTAQPIIATKLCTSGDLSDFKESDRYRLTDVGDLKPIGADGELKSGKLTEESAKNQLETYGKTFALTRKMIINDDLGAFMKVPTGMGQRAARLIDQLFFTRLLANPNSFYSSANKNLLTGTTSALGFDSLQLAIQMFLDQTDADNQPINVEPRFLLVPTALKHTAIELTKGATLIMSGDTDTVRPSLNVLADEHLEVVSSPYLGNSNYSGYSTKGWYLFGNPKQVETWEIGYLNGKRTPTIERGETDFNTLGMAFRVFYDLGIREQEHRTNLHATGVA